MLDIFAQQCADLAYCEDLALARGVYRETAPALDEPFDWEDMEDEI